MAPKTAKTLTKRSKKALNLKAKLKIIDRVTKGARASFLAKNWIFLSRL